MRSKFSVIQKAIVSSCSKIDAVASLDRRKCLGHLVMRNALNPLRAMHLRNLSNKRNITFSSTRACGIHENNPQSLSTQPSYGKIRFFTLQSDNHKNFDEGKHQHHYMDSITKSSVVVKVKDLEEHLRIKGYSTLRWGLGILVAVTFGIYMFREPIKENISDEVADVASRSLGDQNVVLRANEVSKVIVNEILNDSATAALAVSFVIQLLQNDDIIKQAKEFVLQVLSAEDTKENLGKLAADTFADLLTAESTRDLLLKYIRNILLDKQTVESCKQLLDVLASDPESKQILADFFKNVLNSDTVTNEAILLGKTITHEIVIDKNIQEETGNALWDAVMLSLTPKWLVSKDLSKH